MTLPRTLTPAREAIENALFGASSHPLSLSLNGGVFKRVPPARATASAKTVKGSPGAWVHAYAVGGGPLKAQSTLRQLACTAEITLSYWSGDPKSETETASAQSLWESDVPRIVSALCAEALRTAPSGAETGITGGCLLEDGHRVARPTPWPIESGDARVVHVVLTFPFLVELSTT